MINAAEEHSQLSIGHGLKIHKSLGFIFVTAYVACMYTIIIVMICVKRFFAFVSAE